MAAATPSRETKTGNSLIDVAGWEFYQPPNSLVSLRFLVHSAPAGLPQPEQARTAGRSGTSSKRCRFQLSLGRSTLPQLLPPLLLLKQRRWME